MVRCCAWCHVPQPLWLDATVRYVPLPLRDTSTEHDPKDNRIGLRWYGSVDVNCIKNLYFHHKALPVLRTLPQNEWILQGCNSRNVSGAPRLCCKTLWTDSVWLHQCLPITLHSLFLMQRLNWKPTSPMLRTTFWSHFAPLARIVFACLWVLTSRELAELLHHLTRVQNGKWQGYEGFILQHKCLLEFLACYMLGPLGRSNSKTMVFSFSSMQLLSWSGAVRMTDLTLGTAKATKTICQWIK